MKAAAVGALVASALWAAVSAVFSTGAAAQVTQVSAGLQVPNNELTISTVLVADNRQLVTIVDPKTRVMAVYLIDGATGSIALKGVRPVHWDLQLAEFNCTSPLPQEIRSLVEQHTR